MRPVRIIAAAVLTTTVAATGFFIARSTAGHPAAAPAAPVAATPAAPVAAAPPTSLTPKQPVPRIQPPSRPTDPGPVVDSVPRPVLADGRYDAYIRTVDTGRNRLVVDLVQVFHDQAAVDAAIADGKPRDQAQYLSVYVRNQNPRLRTLPLASDLHLDLRGGDCEAPVSQQLTKLAADARLMSGSVHTYYFTLTVAGGAVHRVQEFLAINAC
ncbi:MAG TPA: hypothetical protein VFA46_16125 [Actinomycetes bacterium]|jgi:hypothetical protein|nr:hypothetical protein [Actinomycetes bacterium]